MSNSSANKYPVIARSKELLDSAEPLIPSCTQTLAKGPSQHVRGVAPVYLQRGKGAHVWDVDGNEYIDFNMGIGPLSLGYCFEPVDAAIRAQLEQGITFSLMHPLELEVAELIHEVIPNTEQVRFSKTGADVTSAAVRLARAYTGRDKVICCGYHGWHDWYIGTTDRNAGVPNAVQGLTHTFSYNDIASLKAAIDDNTACVIMEPVIFEPPRKGFLEEVRELCTKHGALLIFDEMWTGFRISLGGAQEFYGIDADMATFSKAVANGMPLSVLTGRKDVLSLLDDKVFFYTTFGGEALSLAAAKATLTFMKEHGVVHHLWNLGQTLQQRLHILCQKLLPAEAKCIGLPYRSLLSLNTTPRADALEMKSFIQQEMFAQGILWGGTHTLSYSHDQSDVDRLVTAYEGILGELKDALEKGDLPRRMRGEKLKPVFRTQTGRKP